MEALKFESGDIGNQLSKISASEIGNLAFGAIMLDARGKVLKYNKTEGEITGRNPSEMLGKTSLRRSLPALTAQSFTVNSKSALVDSGNPSPIFDYKMKPTRLRVQMKKAPGDDDSFLIFVKRV